MSKLFVPKGYSSVLSLYETQTAVGSIKRVFEDKLSRALSLKRVSAPLFVDPETGLNDNLNGVERPVEFDILETRTNAQIVQSLAKWKRMALYRYGFPLGEGLYTDMNAIRRDDDMDNLHSIYVDQWDWERVIERSERNLDTLKEAAKLIFQVFKHVEELVCKKYGWAAELPEELTFLTTAELVRAYPGMDADARELAVCREHGAVFLMQIGDKVGGEESHGSRAPDYDDWAMNGDMLFYYPLLDCAFEVSSMGVRVDSAALREQLKKSGCEARAELPYHREVLQDRLPLTIGGGLGQSRICMCLLGKAHIGEVQAAVWPEEMEKACADAGILLL